MSTPAELLNKVASSLKPTVAPTVKPNVAPTVKPNVKKTLSALEKRQNTVLNKAKMNVSDKVQKTFKLDKDSIAGLEKMIFKDKDGTTSMTSLVQFIIDDFLGIKK